MALKIASGKEPICTEYQGIWSRHFAQSISSTYSFDRIIKMLDSHGPEKGYLIGKIKYTFPFLSGRLSDD